MPDLRRRLALASTSALDAAKTIGICDDTIEARWVQPDGTQLSMAGAHTTKGWGLLSNFGPNMLPRQGAGLLALSSGAARRPGDPNFAASSLDKGYTSAHPLGFPKESPACPGSTTGAPHDGVGA